MAQRSRSRALGTTKSRPEDDQPVIDERVDLGHESAKLRGSAAFGGEGSDVATGARRDRNDADRGVLGSGEDGALSAVTAGNSRSRAGGKPTRKPKARSAESADNSRSGAAPAAAEAKSPPKTGSMRDERAGTAAPVSSRSGRKAKPEPPRYLAAELGQPVDETGEPIGAGSARLRSDRDLQAYALQLWRQSQRGGESRSHLRQIERAGLTADEVWMAGITEMQPTASTPDELRRYRQKLLFRANLLEAILTETVADLHRLEGLEPSPAQTVREPG